MIIGIIGVGNVGCALAVDFRSREHQVLLWAHPDHRGTFYQIRANENYLESTGVIAGCFRMETVEDLGGFIHSVRLIFITVPSQGHDTILAELAKYDLSQHVVIFITGNAGAVVARKRINAKFILDTPTLPYSSRVEEVRVSVRGIKERFQIGPSLSSKLCNEMGKLFSMPLEWKPHVLEVFLSAVNTVVHVPTVIMNLGRIESTNGDFYFYRDGMTPRVCTVIADADKERLAVAAAYGCSVQSALDTYNTNYGTNAKTFREFSQNSNPHNKTKGA